MAVLDATGNKVAEYAYDPYGAPAATSGSTDQPYRYSTKMYDADTGLYYFGYRFYSPDLGRWINRDPLGVRGGLNLYAYALNNPLRYVDVDGLAPKDKLFGLPKRFWDWYHRKVKKGRPPNLEKEEAEELHKEWLEAGKPGPDSKCDRTPSKGPTGNDVIDDILDMIIPVPPIFDPCVYDPSNSICRRGPTWETQ